MRLIHGRFSRRAVLLELRPPRGPMGGGRMAPSECGRPVAISSTTSTSAELTARGCCAFSLMSCRLLKATETVWILGHVLTSWDGKDGLEAPTSLFYQIVDRFSLHVVANIFWGHTYEDEFSVYYATTQQTAQTVLAIGPYHTNHKFELGLPGVRSRLPHSTSWTPIPGGLM
ncbi:hypothetical protein BGW80DRAFT_600751 [Lactifluus volemus]|nr:hypothetical protein BGW80DRAFT_600751 [Lactifluus volemus]